MQRANLKDMVNDDSEISYDELVYLMSEQIDRLDEQNNMLKERVKHLEKKLLKVKEYSKNSDKQIISFLNILEKRKEMQIK